ncbi:MAG: hypothetical protein ACLPND_02655 [Candidatus Korobacteraceae bacterium]
MANDANSSTPSERETRLYQALKIGFVALFVVFLLLLGLSMVHHRFFQGERVHRNGSVGQ